MAADLLASAPQVITEGENHAAQRGQIKPRQRMGCNTYAETHDPQAKARDVGPRPY